MRRRKCQNSGNSLIISLLAGNWAVETGSNTTASATNEINDLSQRSEGAVFVLLPGAAANGSLDRGPPTALSLSGMPLERCSGFAESVRHERIITIRLRPLKARKNNSIPADSLKGRKTIFCIEHELSEEEALRWLIQLIVLHLA